MSEFNDMAQAITDNQPSRYLIVILAILYFFHALSEVFRPACP